MTSTNGYVPSVSQIIILEGFFLIILMYNEVSRKTITSSE